MNQPLLVALSLVKRYGNISVLNKVSFDVRPGEIHALLGANGAGKSTLCRILAGLVSRTAGDIYLMGEPFRPRSKSHAMRQGIQMVQQELNLISTLSVAENLFLTDLPQLYGIVRRKRLYDESRDLLQRLDVGDIDPSMPLSQLGVGQQQMIEIAAAMRQKYRLLILDEPTASLSIRESETLFQWLAQIKKQNVGVIYVTHRLNEVIRLADRFTVLRDGRLITTLPTASRTTEEIIELMSGPDAGPDADGDEDAVSHRECYTTTSTVATTSTVGETGAPVQPASMQNVSVGKGWPRTNVNEHWRGKTHRTVSDINHFSPVLKVERLSSGIVRDICLQVDSGECLGIAGLVGSGRTELLRAIFGADRAKSGQIFIGQDPTAHRFSDPSQAVARGIAMLTEDRKESGVLLPLSVAANSSLSSLTSRFSFGGLIRHREEVLQSSEMCQFMSTRCENVHQSVGTLSGGNQQKVAVSKWLIRDFRVFLMDEPTRGIDLAARQRLYQLIEAMALQGRAVVIASSEIEELMQICDRIIVLSLGEIVAEFARDNWSHDKILQACFAKHLRVREMQDV